VSNYECKKIKLISSKKKKSLAILVDSLGYEMRLRIAEGVSRRVIYRYDSAKHVRVRNISILYVHMFIGELHFDL